MQCSIEKYNFFTNMSYIKIRGGKRPLFLLLAAWGAGGQRFKSSHPDHILKQKRLILFDTYFPC